MSEPERSEEAREAVHHEAANHEAVHHEDGPVPKFLYLVYAGIAAFFAYYLIVHWRG